MSDLWYTIKADKVPLDFMMALSKFEEQYAKFKQLFEQISNIMEVGDDNYVPELLPWLFRLAIKAEKVEAVKNTAFDYGFTVTPYTAE